MVWEKALRSISIISLWVFYLAIWWVKRPGPAPSRAAGVGSWPQGALLWWTRATQRRRDHLQAKQKENKNRNGFQHQKQNHQRCAQQADQKDNKNRNGFQHQKQNHQRFAQTLLPSRSTSSREKKAVRLRCFINKAVISIVCSSDPLINDMVPLTENLKTHTQ